MKWSIFVSLILLLISSSSKAQIPYPFYDNERDRDILAYWYNIPQDSTFAFGKRYFHSSLQIYGKVRQDLLQVKAQAYLKTGEKIFDHEFHHTDKPSDLGGGKKSFSLNVNGGFFRLSFPVEYLEQKPDKIVVTLKSSNETRTKEIQCRYHKVFGNITDFKGDPFKAFVVFGPDRFSSPTGVWSDSSGYYEIELPERTYNTIIVTNESYGETTLEAWGWHIIVDSDQRLDFKVGTGEVYNLNVWSNNGGGSTYFISFRPMVLMPEELINYRKSGTTINGKEWKVSDIAPELNLEDVKVTVNGQEAGILSLQKYYETSSVAMPSYLIQVDRQELAWIGKQTVKVEYEKEMGIGGKMVLCNSMGYFQFFLNHSGLSKYF